MKYTYEELTKEELEVYIKWVLKINPYKELNYYKDIGVITNKEGNKIFGVHKRKDDYINLENYKKLTLLEPNMNNYEDKLGNKIYFIKYKGEK